MSINPARTAASAVPSGIWTAGWIYFAAPVLGMLLAAQVHLLQRLKIKGDKFNKSTTVPDYVHDIAKVQIWCAWAEANLGEASFDKPVQLTGN